ncbi:MAG: trehalose-phosphatase [Geobacteraceae bacterium]|nr:trehalose-phosphatase [Geobacteraceae bacterium]
MRLWLFDFDGTLSSLVDDRNAAVMHPACVSMLKGLSQSKTDQVAIISSRTLEDVLQRVPLKDVIVGGNSGMEWQLPGGCRVSLGSSRKEALLTRRGELMPAIEKLGRKDGFEIEDKHWSVAIHIDKKRRQSLDKTVQTIVAWAMREKITLYRGPDVLEIQFLDGFNKSMGATFLAELLKIDTIKDQIIYSGDDENDAVAMWWAIMAGGKAIMVGARFDLPGAIYVKDQEALAETVQMLTEHDRNTSLKYGPVHEIAGGLSGTDRQSS